MQRPANFSDGLGSYRLSATAFPLASTVRGLIGQSAYKNDKASADPITPIASATTKLFVFGPTGITRNNKHNQCFKIAISEHHQASACDFLDNVDFGQLVASGHAKTK